MGNIPEGCVSPQADWGNPEVPFVWRMGGWGGDLGPFGLLCMVPVCSGWPCLYRMMKKIIVSQIPKLKEQPKHLRPCYQDKWVSGKTDVTLPAPPTPVCKALVYVSFVSLFSFVSARSCNSPGQDGINSGDLGCLVAACFFQGPRIQGSGREDWRINLSVSSVGVLLNELWDMVPSKQQSAVCVTGEVFFPESVEGHHG